MITREQMRAQQVFEKVSGVAGQNFAREYGSFSLSFPAFVHGCGLCQAVAFVQAKQGDAGRKLALRTYLNHLAACCGYSDSARFADEIRRADLVRYQYLTREVMAYANWFKRYSEALLDSVPGQENKS